MHGEKCTYRFASLYQIYIFISVYQIQTSVSEILNVGPASEASSLQVSPAALYSYCIRVINYSDNICCLLLGNICNTRVSDTPRLLPHGVYIVNIEVARFYGANTFPKSTQLSWSIYSEH